MCVSYGARWRAHGDHSPRATPRQQSRYFYIAERAPRARAFWLSLLVFSLSHCVSVSRRFSSLSALSFRLCRRSAFVSAGALHLVSAGTSVSSLPALCSHCSLLCWRSAWCLPLFCSDFCCQLCSRLYSASVSSRLGYASRSSRGPQHMYIYLFFCN